MSKIIKCWVVALKDDDFIPSFNVEEKFKNVMQVHEDRKSAEKLVEKLGNA